MILGCIADDFTGASDLANTLAREGMRTVQVNGVPEGEPEGLGGVEAAVVALKTRSIPARDAVSESRRALDWLRARGCRQILFKYCSTFDSTPEGNIGPVAEALAEALDAESAVFCPAFPGAGRTIYQGHLFVQDRLLSESGMEAHPLNPMTDPDLRRWLARQTRREVGHVPLAAVAEGPAAVAARIAAEAAAGRPFVIVDAITDKDLRILGAALEGAALVTGGSGVAIGLPEGFRRQGLLSGIDTPWEGAKGPGAVLSGSCSNATRAQVAAYRGRAPALEIEADAVMAGETTGESVADWMLQRLDAAPLAFSSAEPAEVAAAQARHGREPLARALEATFAGAAARLVAGGVERLVVAGGETSGAVVEALKPPVFEIGPEIAPGVPALRAGGLALALKSGNFGAEAFFGEALDVLGGTAP